MSRRHASYFWSYLARQMKAFYDRKNARKIGIVCLWGDDRMDWIRSLNRAIGYIEENLLTDLSCEDIAEHIYSSNFHFQRVFSLLTQMAVGEYIRSRRLSLSAFGQLYDIIIKKTKAVMR